jgi:hypothetical protein
MLILIAVVVVVEKARAEDIDDPVCALQCIARQRAAEEREAGRRRLRERRRSGGVVAGDLKLEAKDRRNIRRETAQPCLKAMDLSWTDWFCRRSFFFVIIFLTTQSSHERRET